MAGPCLTSWVNLFLYQHSTTQTTRSRAPTWRIKNKDVESGHDLRPCAQRCHPSPQCHNISTQEKRKGKTRETRATFLHHFMRREAALRQSRTVQLVDLEIRNHSRDSTKHFFSEKSGHHSCKSSNIVGLFRLCVKSKQHFENPT